jgi:hypothetical protein
VCVNGDTYRVRSLKQVSLDFLSPPLSGAEMILWRREILGNCKTGNHIARGIRQSMFLAPERGLILVDSLERNVFRSVSKNGTWKALDRR